jgi:hypothetical protein
VPDINKITAIEDLDGPNGDAALRRIAIWALRRHRIRDCDQADGADYVVARMRQSAPKWIPSLSRLSYANWLFRAARCAAMTFWKKSTRGGKLYCFSDARPSQARAVRRFLESIADPHPGPDYEMQARELRESIRDFVIRFAQENFTDFERDVFFRRAAGQEYSEISTGIAASGRPTSRKAVDDALQRIRIKGAKFLRACQEGGKPCIM